MTEREDRDNAEEGCKDLSFNYDWLRRCVVDVVVDVVNDVVDVVGIDAAPDIHVASS